jgi:hypothetical protein
MCKSLFVLLASVTALALVPTLSADDFSYSYNGSGFNASLTYTANQVSGDPGVYEITNVAGTIYAAGGDIPGPVSFDVAVYSDPNGVNPNTVDLSNVDFIYDNLLTPGATPTLDYYGVLFEVNDLYFNLYSNDDTYQWADDGTYTNLSNLSDPMTDPPGTASEPDSLCLFGSALLALATLLLLKRRPSSHSTNT